MATEHRCCGSGLFGMEIIDYGGTLQASWTTGNLSWETSGLTGSDTLVLIPNLSLVVKL